MTLHVVGGGWDERRNTSRVVPVPPDAARLCRVACERWARENEAHYRWLRDGAPMLTHAEHLARFGEPYKPHASRRVSG